MARPKRKRLTRTRTQNLKGSQRSYYSRGNRSTGRSLELYADLDKKAKHLARTTTKTGQQIADELDVNVNTVRKSIKGIKRKKVVAVAGEPTTHDLQRRKAKEVRRIFRRNKKFKKTNPEKVMSNDAIRKHLKNKFNSSFSKKTLKTIKAHFDNGKRFIPQPRISRKGETSKQRAARITAERIEAEKAVKSGKASDWQKHIVKQHKKLKKEAADAERARRASTVMSSKKGNVDWKAISKLTPSELEDLAVDKGSNNFYEAKSGSRVYETLPDGTKIQVGDRWVTSGPKEDAKIKKLYIKAWRDYLAAGGEKPLQSVDHTGPGGNPQVIRSSGGEVQRTGGGVKTKGGIPWFVGFSNILNMRLMDPIKNIQKHNVFTEHDAEKMARAQMRWLKARNLGLAGFGALLASSFLPSGSKIAEAAQTGLKYAEPILDPAMFLLRPEGQSTDVEDTADFRYMKGYDNIMDREYDVSRLSDPNWGGTLKRLL